MHGVAPDPVIATVGVGINPSWVAITPDGKTAYVANSNGNNDIDGANTISVIDTATNLLVTIIADDPEAGAPKLAEPYTITLDTPRNLAYVTNSNGSTVSIIDTTNNTLSMDEITGFDGPSGLVMTPDGTKAYVNNYGGPDGVMSGNGNTISVVNLDTQMIVKTITINTVPPQLPAAPAAVAITPIGDFVYVLNYVDGNIGTGTVSVIRTADDTIVDTITGFSGPYGISITPDGKFAYVTNFGSNNFTPFGTTVSVIDLMTKTISETIEVGIQPSGVAVTPDGKYVYVTVYNTQYLGPMFTDLTALSDFVKIIDTSTKKVIEPVITAGLSPAAVTISPDGRFAYVPNYTSNNVTVIGIPLFALTVQGQRTANVFLMQRDIIDKLTWTVSGEDLPSQYNIYRDSALTDLVGIVRAGDTLEFLDHNRRPDVAYTYYVVGINLAGITSYPVSVTV